MEKKIYIVKLMQEGGWAEDPQVMVLGYVQDMDALLKDVISSCGESIWVEVEEIKELKDYDVNLIIDSKENDKLYKLYESKLLEGK